MATPVTGYVFRGWSENGLLLGRSPFLVLPMTQARQVVAVYEPIRTAIAVNGSLAFGNKPRGSRTGKILTITNLGNAPVRLQNIEIRGAARFGGGFSAIGAGVLQPGARMNVFVRFTPSVKRKYFSTLILRFDGPSPFARPVQLSGVGF